MAENKEFQAKLKKLKGLSKLAGIDLEQTLNEYQQYTIDLAIERIKPLLNQQPPVNIDMDALAEKIIPALRVELVSYIDKAVSDSEVRIAGKIATVTDELLKRINAIQATGAGHDDIQKIIDSVGEMLKPILIDQIQKSAENVMRANIQALQAEIYRKIDEKFSTVKTVSPSPENDDQGEKAPPPATNQGGNLFGGLGGLVNVVFAAAQEYPEGFKLITSLFTKPGADPGKKLREVYDLSKIISGLKLDEPAADKLIEHLTDAPKA